MWSPTPKRGVPPRTTYPFRWLLPGTRAGRLETVAEDSASSCVSSGRMRSYVQLLPTRSRFRSVRGEPIVSPTRPHPVIATGGLVAPARDSPHPGRWARLGQRDEQLDLVLARLQLTSLGFRDGWRGPAGLAIRTASTFGSDRRGRSRAGRTGRHRVTPSTLNRRLNGVRLPLSRDPATSSTRIYSNRWRQ